LISFDPQTKPAQRKFSGELLAKALLLLDFGCGMKCAGTLTLAAVALAAAGGLCFLPRLQNASCSHGTG
jgi:hypothetical protein